MALSYLYPPEIQFQSRAGVNNTAGFLRVFYTQTDDRAPTYSDFGGTLNEADIVLDADGRAVVIVDDTKTYRLEVYNRNRGLMFTCDPVTAMGGSGGGSVGTKIVSTDGSVNITVSSGGGITVYDLSTVLTQDAAKWGVTNVLRSFTDGDGSWEQMPLVSSVGSAAYSDGWTAECAQAYDLEACIEIQSGSATATSMLDARFDVEVDGVVVKSQYGSLDPTRPMDRVTFGWKGELAEGQVVNGRLFVKTDEAMNIGLLGHVMYNAEVDGVVGSGGGGGGNEYYAGQYIEISTGNFISVTGVAPAGNYVYKNEISAQSSLWNTVSGKEDKVNWGLSGNTVTSINGHDLAGADYSAGQYVDITGNVISVTGLQPSGDYAYNSAVSSKVDQSAFDDCCSSMSGAVSSLQVDVSAISAAVSGVTGQTGNYVEKSSISAESSVWNTVSGKQDSGYYLSATDSALFQPAGNYLSSTDSALFQPAGNYLSSTDSALFQPVSGMSAYVDTATFEDCCSAMSGAVSSLSSDVSAISGAVSGLTGQYVEISAISAQSSVWNSASSVSSKLDESAFTAYTSTASNFTGVTTDGTLTGDGTTGSALGVNRMELDFDSSMTTSVNGSTATVGVNTGILSGYIPTSVSSDYMQVTGMSAYAYESSNSAKLDESAFTAYTATATSFTGVTTDSSLTGDGTTGNALGVNGMELVFDSSMSTSVAGDSAIVGVDTASITAAVATGITGFIPTSESANYMQVTGMSAYQPSGDYAYNSAVSSKLDESAFTAYTSTATSFTGVTTDATLTGDGTTGSALGVNRMELAFDTSMVTSISAGSAIVGVDTAGITAAVATGFIPTGESSKYMQTSGMSAYQEISGMSAYQPSGDYAFNSSLSSKLDQSALELTGEWVSGIELSGSSYKLYAGWATEASMAQTAYYDSEGNDLNAYVHALSANSGDWNSVSAKQDTSAMTAYQEVSGMTAYQPAGDYQPSGDYIYESALGWAEV